MKPTSEYTFPIFISSTHYNLVDLRAELSDFLSNLGYRPILSSADGFPDEYPHLQPWESCLSVLNTSFVMILIIDGRYGQGLDWKNSGDIFKDKKVSPTHGEYIHAHTSGKRMMVFIRAELMVHYQSYRELKTNYKENPDKVKEILSEVLPAHIDFKTIEFIHEVKTTTPIPWIKEFNDVTDIKHEVQKKMLNELFTLFAVKERHLESVVNAFNQIMTTLSPEQQEGVLQKIGIGKDFIALKDKLSKKEQELDDVYKQLDEQKAAGENNADVEAKYKRLAIEKSLLEQRLGSTGSHFHVENGKVYLNTPPKIPTSSYFDFVDLNSSTFYQAKAFNSFVDKCDKCGRNNSLSVTPGKAYFSPTTFKECPSCERKICSQCWPQDDSFVTGTVTGICPDCRIPKK